MLRTQAEYNCLLRYGNVQGFNKWFWTDGIFFNDYQFNEQQSFLVQLMLMRKEFGFMPMAIEMFPGSALSGTVMKMGLFIFTEVMPWKYM